MKKKDIILGAKFGIYTVIKEVDSDKQGHRSVLILCENGNEHIVRLASIKSYKAYRCGKCKLDKSEILKKRASITLAILDKKYGCWQPLEVIRNKYGKLTTNFICLCDCGEKRKIGANQLRSLKSPPRCSKNPRYGKEFNRETYLRSKQLKQWKEKPEIIETQNKCQTPRSYIKRERAQEESK